MNLADGTFLVTGAASGIGAACAHLLAERGAAKLVLVDRDEIALDLSCAVDRFTGDVGDPALWERIEEARYPLDGAVLNAGVSSGAPLAELSFEEWRRVLATNLDGMFLSLRCAIRLAREGASLVCMASVSGVKAEAGTGAYGASKAGVIQLAKVAAKEGAARGIRVNAMAPGGVDTPIWDTEPFFRELVKQHSIDRQAALDAMAGAATPLGRFSTAEEIAGQAAFLLSEASAGITGAVLVNDGGYSL